MRMGAIVANPGGAGLMELLVVLIGSGVPLLILVLVLYLLVSTHRSVKRIEERLHRESTPSFDAPSS